MFHCAVIKSQPYFRDYRNKTVASRAFARWKQRSHQLCRATKQCAGCSPFSALFQGSRKIKKVGSIQGKNCSLEIALRNLYPRKSAHPKDISGISLHLFDERCVHFCTFIISLCTQQLSYTQPLMYYYTLQAMQLTL